MKDEKVLQADHEPAKTEDQKFQERATEVVRHQVEATNQMLRDNPNFEVPY